MEPPRGEEGLLTLQIPRPHPGAGEGPGNLHSAPVFQLSLMITKVDNHWPRGNSPHSTLLTLVLEYAYIYPHLQ